MNQFRKALQDRPNFYLSLFFFVMGTVNLGRLELKGWAEVYLAVGTGLTVGTAVYFWGKPKSTGNAS